MNAAAEDKGEGTPAARKRVSLNGARRAGIGLLALTVALGGALRLARLDLMEFKSDEVQALVLTRYWLQHGVPQYGMLSGVGVRNPPGLPDLLLPVVACTANPLAAAFYIAAFNIAAIVLVWRLGCAVRSRAAGLWAAALVAVHPWLVLYSRKIWAQSLLPFFATLFLLALVRCTQRPRSRCVFWLPPLAILAWQLHYSAYAVLAVLGLWGILQAWRRRLHWGAAVFGLLAALLIAVPYLNHLIATGFADFRRSLAVGGAGPWPAARLWFDTFFAGGFGYPFGFRPAPLTDTPLGQQFPWLQPWVSGATWAVFILAAVGAATAIAPRLARLRTPAPPEGETEPILWLGLFAITPLCLYFLRGIRAEPHYFVVSLPAALTLAGCGAARLMRRGEPRALRVAAAAAGAASAAAGAVLVLLFLAWIRLQGGTGGDYGTAYSAQREAARLLHAHRVNPARVDARLMRDHGISLHYTLEHVFHPQPPYGEGSALVADTLLYPEEACPENAARRQAGPLLLCLPGTAEAAQ